MLFFVRCFLFVIFGTLFFIHYFSFIIFWALCGPKNGRGPTHAHIGLGSQNPTKKLTHGVDLLGQLLSRNHVSDFLGTTPSPLPPINDGVWKSFCVILQKNEENELVRGSRDLLSFNKNLLFYNIRY